MEITPVPRASEGNIIVSKPVNRPRLYTASIEELKQMESGPLSPFTRKKPFDMKINADLREYILEKHQPVMP